MDGDPSRPADPWKANWGLPHTERRFRGTVRGFLRLFVLVWLPVIAGLAVLSLFLPTRTVGIIAAVAFLGLLATARI
jgi:hypothetical protein